MLFHAIIPAGLRHGVPAERMSTLIEPLTRPIYFLLFGLIAMLAAAIAASSFIYQGEQQEVPIICLLTFIGGGMALRRMGHDRIGGALEASALFLLIGMAGMFLSVVLAATAQPYADRFLIRADAVLGLDWLVLVDGVKDNGAFMTWAARIYLTLNWQPFVAIGALFVVGLGRRCWIFLHAWIIALVVTLAIFPFFPAVGGLLHYGIPPILVPTAGTSETWLDVLNGARGGSLRVIDTRSLVGLVDREE